MYGLVVEPNSAQDNECTVQCCIQYSLAGRLSFYLISLDNKE